MGVVQPQSPSGGKTGAKINIPNGKKLIFKVKLILNCSNK
jgi:hypothetical protein